MRLLLLLIVGGLWAFYVTLLLDRPDLAHVVPDQYAVVVHVGFGLFFLWIVYAWSDVEIRTSKSWWRNGPGIFLRNLVVIGLGVGLLVFTCREVLHGVDPTGRADMLGIRSCVRAPCR